MHQIAFYGLRGSQKGTRYRLTGSQKGTGRQSHTDMPAQHDHLEITTMDALFTDFGIAMLGVLLVGMPFFGKRFD